MSVLDLALGGQDLESVGLEASSQVHVVGRPRRGAGLKTGGGGARRSARRPIGCDRDDDDDHDRREGGGEDWPAPQERIGLGDRLPLRMLATDGPGATA